MGEKLEFHLLTWLYWCCDKRETVRLIFPSYIILRWFVPHSLGEIKHLNNPTQVMSCSDYTSKMWNGEALQMVRRSSHTCGLSASSATTARIFPKFALFSISIKVRYIGWKTNKTRTEMNRNKKYPSGDWRPIITQESQASSPSPSTWNVHHLNILLRLNGFPLVSKL